ncbi:MAG TPA: hypothetical protein ENK74_06155, partial [Nitratifractor sp.]|nr:hypothetical protein [Nitratifractor sp.]
MKKVIVAVIGVSLLFAGAESFKKYGVKSGKVEYKITGSGNIMGMGKIKIVGKSRLLFDDYGKIELKEESKVQQTAVMGNVQNEKSHTLTLQKEGTFYSADFGRKRVVKSEVPLAGAVKTSGKSAQQIGFDMLKKMGGKKVGSSTILGYKCDIWELMGTKQCIYKGVPLSITSNIMGMQTKEIATKAEFDINIDKSSFKLPDFPVTDMYGNAIGKKSAGKVTQNGMPQGVDMSKAMEGMAKMAAALQNSGVDSSSKKPLTNEQKELMQKAAMSAMGGEKAVFREMKNEILSQVENGGIEFAKSCFGSAQTLEAANRC